MPAAAPARKVRTSACRLAGSPCRAQKLPATSGWERRLVRGGTRGLLDGLLGLALDFLLHFFGSHGPGGFLLGSRLGLLGRDVDLVGLFLGLPEVADGATQAAADLGQLLGTEKDENNKKNDEHFLHADTHGQLLCCLWQDWLVERYLVRREGRRVKNAPKYRNS